MDHGPHFAMPCETVSQYLNSNHSNTEGIFDGGMKRRKKASSNTSLDHFEIKKNFMPFIAIYPNLT